MERSAMRVVRLLEPELCVSCRFARIADVQTVNGTSRRMIQCNRLDCDNWDTLRSEDAIDVDVRDEAA